MPDIFSMSAHLHYPVKIAERLNGGGGLPVQSGDISYKRTPEDMEASRLSRVRGERVSCFPFGIDEYNMYCILNEREVYEDSEAKKDGTE
jgi:hypothetical protein